MKTTYLLIGGGLACMQAAKLVRMKDPDGAVTLVAKEPHLPYDRPPLSKEFLRGEKEASQLFYEPDTFFEESRIDTILGDQVVSMDVGAREVALAGGRKITFDKALIATGGEPIRLDLPGAELDGVFYLRSIDDARAIAERAAPGRKAVVIGGGFIGIETAASLTALGVEATVVEAQPHIWPRFLDPSLAAFVREHCEGKGVRFVTGEVATRIVGSTDVAGVVTTSGRELPCDFICVGVGIRPETRLAEEAGLEVDDGIVVDHNLQTSQPGIYAAGDVANYPDPVFGKRRRIEHWGHAEYGGQVAGLNMTGDKRSYDLLSYVWSDVFDLHVEFAGDESERDRVLVRGTAGRPPITVLYLQDDRLTAYFAINSNSREYSRLQRLIRAKTDLAGKDRALEDPAFDLKTLL